MRPGELAGQDGRSIQFALDRRIEKPPRLSEGLVKLFRPFELNRDGFAEGVSYLFHQRALSSFCF